MTTEKKIRRRRPSTFPAVLSITLVLFLFGLLGLVLFNAKKITDYLKENFEIQVFYKDSTDEQSALKHCLDMKSNGGVKSVEFVDKQQAAEKMKTELGQDFIEALGANPLPHGSLIYLKSNFTNDAFVKKFAADLMLNPLVSDVRYPVNLLQEMNRNISVIGTILLALSFVFLIIAIGLINSTIRLTMFAKRFTIKSMLLVGATEWFIIKPFLAKFAMVGLISALIAGALLSGVLTLLIYWYPWLFELFDAKLYIFIFGVLILTGILIVEISAWFSTRKYLRIKLDLLY